MIRRYGKGRPWFVGQTDTNGPSIGSAEEETKDFRLVPTARQKFANPRALIVQSRDYKPHFLSRLAPSSHLRTQDWDAIFPPTVSYRLPLKARTFAHPLQTGGESYA